MAAATRRRSAGPAGDLDPPPTDAEIAVYVALMEERGLLEVHTDEQGREGYRLTEDGIRVGNMLAMADSEDADSVLEVLLGAGMAVDSQARAVFAAPPDPVER